MTLPLTEKIVDEKLPQMNELTDAPRMCALFQRTLLAATDHHLPDYHLETCRLLRVRYRPGRNCLAAYSLTLTERETGRKFEQMLSVTVYGKGESRERFERAQQQSIFPTAIGDGLFHLPELEAVVWMFPNDRKLAWLPVIANSERLKNEILPGVLSRSFGEARKITALTTEIVHYAAERACTVRVTLKREGEAEPMALFGKTYCEGEGEPTWQAMQALWQSDGRVREQLLIPQPLAFQPESNTIWQFALSGKTLLECDDGSESFYELLEKAGAAIAALHRCDLSGLSQLGIADVISRLESAEQLIATVCPQHRQTLNSLVGRLIMAAKQIGERPLATLHGDLHLKNFFVTDDRIVQVGLIDLDNLHCGDPWQDVGSFAAAIHCQGLIEGKTFDHREQIVRRFADAYRSNARYEFSDAALNWHTAAALIGERARRCLIRLKANELDAIIELANRFSQKL